MGFKYLELGLMSNKYMINQKKNNNKKKNKNK